MTESAAKLLITLQHTCKGAELSSCILLDNGFDTRLICRTNYELVTCTLDVFLASINQLKVEALDQGRYSDVHLSPGEAALVKAISILRESQTHAGVMRQATYYMPKQFRVPLENGAKVLSDLFPTSNQRAGLKVCGCGYNFSSMCIRRTVIPTGVPTGMRH